MKYLFENNLILYNKKELKSILEPTKSKINFINTSGEIKNGYGACKASGCGCNGFKPNDPKDDYCRVCGHHWTRYW